MNKTTKVIRLALRALGVSAFAFGAQTSLGADPVAYLDPVFDAATGAVTGMVERTCTEYATLSGNYTDDLTLTGGWYVVVGNCTISKSKSVKTTGAARLILKDGTSFVKSEADNHTGFLVEQGPLTVYAQSTNADTMGVLQITGGKYAAAIGSGSADEIANAPITINGGMVTATGGEYGAAIGSGKTAEEKSEKGAGQDVTINGGIVTANGGDKSAGIGGGEKSIGQRITVNGGTVVATGGGFGAGIGGGDTQDGRDITINGGHVTANGGKVAAGIGGGKKGPGHAIAINGGTVVATGGDDDMYHGGAGIGGGNDGASDSRGEGYDITINGGHVTATGGLDGAGIGGSGLRDGHHITINGGTVVAKGRENAAGIGGGDRGNGHHITINGGHVTAHGEEKSAGIGGGDDAHGYQITINGGYVEAKSLSTGGAGIGGGQGGSGYEILIGGGEVYAVADEKGAGIGGGDDGKGHHITITNGYVEATCSRKGGAGIGGGDAIANDFNTDYFYAYAITISGGEVHATGADGGAGIGAPNDSCCTNILISGGTIVAQSINNDDTVVGGAGIGGGDEDVMYGATAFTSDWIAITGGDITARGGVGGAGIGGGNMASVGHIMITGGDIKAYGGIKGGAGIGGGGRWGNAHEITITGGRILALAGGSWTLYDPEHYAEHMASEWRDGTLWWGRGMDIGGGGAFDVTPLVRDLIIKLVGFIPEVGWIISGIMSVTEKLVDLGHELNGMTKENYGGIEKIRIAGGTIEAHAIGGDVYRGKKKAEVVIDGGSLLAAATSHPPKNSAGKDVVPIQFKEAAGFSPAHLVIPGYGTNDLYPDTFGDLYLWLPIGTYQIILDGVERELTVWGAWQYTLDGKKPGIQVGDTAWAEIRNGVCYVVGQGEMWNVSNSVDVSALWDSRNSISNLLIGGQVTTVGKRNFEYMKKLKKVSISTNVVTVADQAFFMCYNVTNISVGAGTQKIGAYAFQGCNSLEMLSFGYPVANTDPTAYTLTAHISMESGEPVVEAVPKVEIPGYEMVLFGKKELSDPTWTLVTDENKSEFRFFKVVSQPK